MVDEANRQKREMFAHWVEAHNPPPPFLGVFGAPSYALETLTERIEPSYSEYSDLVWEHPYENDECSEPDPQWYRPTKKLLDLERRMAELRAKAFREVPNPDYDPVRAAAYWEKQRNPYGDATTIMTGQSYNPEIPT